MALSRFVLTATVTLTPDTLATVVAGEPGTGAPAGPGNTATVTPGTSGKYGYLPATLLRGMVITADSSAGTTGPQLLYQRSDPAICAPTSRARTTPDTLGWRTRSWSMSEQPQAVWVFLTNATGTSGGTGPGPKQLPPAEAAALVRDRLAVYGRTPPVGYHTSGPWVS